MKFTPGPWKWDNNDLWHIGKGYMPNEKDDPNYYLGVEKDDNTTRHNAYLIAAAPEMYEMLEHLHAKILKEGMRDIVFGAMFSEEVGLLDDLLRKARGE